LQSIALATPLKIHLLDRSVDNFDSVEDMSILDSNAAGVAGKIFGATYSRPSESDLAAGGLNAMVNTTIKKSHFI